MSAAVKCELCGVVFAPFTGADNVVRAFNAHPCITRTVEQSRRNHPTFLPGGAA